MDRVQVAQLKAHLSQYLAGVRRGASLTVCDRKTPIARLVPYVEASDALTVREPTGSIDDLKRVAGVKPKRPVDVVRLLRESRTQR